MDISNKTMCRRARAHIDALETKVQRLLYEREYYAGELALSCERLLSHDRAMIEDVYLDQYFRPQRLEIPSETDLSCDMDLRNDSGAHSKSR